MSKIKLTLPAGMIPITGKQVSFIAPCDFGVADCLQIAGVDYSVVKADGSVPVNSWKSGNIVSVILDIENSKAFILNSSDMSRPLEMTKSEFANIEPVEGQFYIIIDDDDPIPIASGGTGATDAETARTNLGAASTETITVSVGTSWTEDTTNGGYYQTCTATGMAAGDNPVVDVILGSDVDANVLYKEAWACVDRVVTADDSVKVYANEEAPKTAFTFQAKVVR